MSITNLYSRTEFSNAVKEKLGYYVYFLRDPSNNEVFYIGKGKENRLFQHVLCSIENPESSDKISKIEEIHAKGNKVEHIVLRHGLSDDEAKLVEATLIDFVGKDHLSNVVKGYHSNDFGAKSPEEIEIMYGAKPCEIQEATLIININRLFKQTMTAEELYKATRASWVLGERRNKAKYAIASFRGIVREVYKIHEWEESSVNGKTRWGFEGSVAENDIREKYLHKSLEKYIKKGAQNPIKYVCC